MNDLTLGATAIRQLDGLYSLNDLHAAAGGAKRHQPSDFLRLAQTQALAEEIHSADSRSACKTINGGTNRGTYVCRELVYAYAMWISPAFHLKVIRAFDAAQTAATTAPVFDAAARKKLINRRAWALAQADYARYQALMEQSLPADASVADIHAWTPPPMLPATRIKQALAILGMEGGAQ